MLDRYFTDLTVLSIAANGKEMSFSSDTGMGECLVIARKRKAGESQMTSAHFVSLHHRPRGFAEADSIAKNILDSSEVRQLEDGPYGGERVIVGDGLVGEMLSTPLKEDGENWGAVRLLDSALAQTALFPDAITTLASRSGGWAGHENGSVERCRQAGSGRQGYKRYSATWTIYEDRV